jgi:AP-3 complex subunit sigma
MIKGVMIINNHGKPRLTKFYEHLVRVAYRARRRVSSYDRFRAPHYFGGRAQSVDKQQQMIREMYALISKRSERVCNFLEEVRSVLRILIEWAN